MLYTSFKNYEEFKQLFPIRVYDGRQCRSNKILLSLYKSGRWFFHSPLRGISNMAELEDKCLEMLTHHSDPDNAGNPVEVMGRVFRSHEVRTDDAHGICEDGDVNSVRVHLLENGRERLCKRKAGKFIRAIIAEHEVGRNYPEEVINYLCEQFTTKWKAHVTANNPLYVLHVDSDFSAIYNGRLLDGDFGSCMTNKGHHTFYSNALEGARAAYITSRVSGLILARAVIYNALDEDDRQWRLCERQYSTTEILKQTLVNMLIAGGHIDGYKAIGASCHDATNFVDVNNRSIGHHTFRCRCILRPNHTVSYQDSFKWYYPAEGLVYNRQKEGRYVSLSTTSRTVSIGLNYDEYHQRYTDHGLLRVWYNGELTTCAANEMDDFERITMATHCIHRSHIHTCRITNRYFQTMSPTVACYGSYSSVLGEWFYSDYARSRAEAEYEQQAFIECEDGNRHDPAECFYSEMLDRYFWFEHNLEAAEREHLASVHAA